MPRLRYSTVRRSLLACKGHISQFNHSRTQSPLPTLSNPPGMDTSVSSTTAAHNPRPPSQIHPEWTHQSVQPQQHTIPAHPLKSTRNGHIGQFNHSSTQSPPTLSNPPGMDTSVSSTTAAHNPRPPSQIHPERRHQSVQAQQHTIPTHPLKSTPIRLKSKNITFQMARAQNPK